MNIRELVEVAHRIAKDHGFWAASHSPLHYHALIHSEISEATEEARKDTPPIYAHHKDVPVGNPAQPYISTDALELFVLYPSYKPEGELTELADAVIRIADYCGSKGWDLEQAIKTKMAYNESRPYLHGKKF